MGIEKYKHNIEFIILIVFLLLIWYLGRFFRIDTEAIQKSVKGFPLIFGGILYILLYVIVTFFIFFSKDAFWLTAAVLFGAVYSTLFICIAEAINTVILFHLSRCLGRTYVEKKLTKKYRELDEMLGEVSLFWLFIFRVAPLIPYRFLDLAIGLTRIRFRRYFAAVILGTPLKMFWIQYILTNVGKNIFSNPSALVEYFLNNKTLFMFSFIYIILVIAVVLKLKFKD